MTVTEHQANWWGTQNCRRCNFQSAPKRQRSDYAVCPDCDGSGWTVWAAMALEPWTQIVPNLWMGGVDFNCSTTGGQRIVSKSPQDLFAVVISLYRRDGFDPHGQVAHHVSLFADSGLDTDKISRANLMAAHAADAVREGKKTLIRCQAGLNRSGLVTGLALRSLGYSAQEAIDMIRAKRSPWALCNEHFEAYLLDPSNTN